MVTGVIKNHKNSHLRFSLVFPFQLYKEIGVDIDTSNRYNYTTYILLRENVDAESFNNKIKNYLTSYFPDIQTSLETQRLSDIYLYSDFSYDVHTETSNIALIYIMAAIAFFILLIACINFINLSTAVIYLSRLGRQ